MFGILKLCIDTSVETYWYKVVRELISITWSFWSPIYWTLKQQSAGGDWIDVLILSNILWNEQFDFLILELYLGRETFVNTFMLQIAVLSNHLNGRDTHVRQIKVYGPRPCVFYLSVHNLLFTSFVSDYKYTDLNTPPPPLFFFFSNAQFRNPFPHQPFQFTSREFVMYSSVRWEIWPCQQRRRIVKLSQEERWSM